MLNTKDVFQRFTTEKITENIKSEIEENLKAFFQILLNWDTKKEGCDN